MDRWNTPREEKYLGLTPAQFNLAFFAIVGAIGLVVAIYFGAFGAVLGSSGGDGSSSEAAVVEKATPTPAGEASPAPTLTAEEAANSAVLKLDDMPSGWTKDAPDDDDDDDDLEFSEECSILNELEDPPGQIAYAESNEFEGPDSQSVNSDASVFSNEATAQEALDTFNSAFSLCRDEAVAAFEEALLEEWALRGYDMSSVGVDFALEDLAFPPFGDSMATFRLVGTMIVEDVGFTFVVDFVAILKGRMVGGFIYSTLGDVNSFEEEVLAETAANKLAEANASLAE